VKTFEDVVLRLGRDRPAGIRHPQQRLRRFLSHGNANQPVRPIVLSRVLQEILQNERNVAFLSSDV
jgi:hypothetical protein